MNGKLKGTEKWTWICAGLGAGVLALAVICGAAGWRAASAQEEEIAYLREFTWEVPLTENQTVVNYADYYFRNTGGADPAVRASELADFRNTSAMSDYGIFNDYLGEKEKEIWEIVEGTQSTYVNEKKEVIFKNKNLWQSEVLMELSDTYAVLHKGKDGGYRLVDLQGNTMIETSARRRIEGVDNRYVAVGDDVNTFNKLYDVKTGEYKQLPYTCAKISQWYEGWYKAIVDFSFSETYMGFVSGTVFLDEDMNIAMGGAVFNDSTYFSANLSEGLFYGVKEKRNIEGNINDNGLLPRGYFDKSGKQVIETKNADFASDFSEGKAMIYASGKKVYCIDRDGRVLFEKTLSEEVFPLNDFFTGWKAGFVDDRVVICDGEKCGVADERGKWIVKPVFDEIYLAKDGKAVVVRGEKFGVLQLERGQGK
ncbi:MAG: WG repeat-containing protein [Emergencia sp.]|nr:WG repeat-containing protein [Emergencia sp.]